MVIETHCITVCYIFKNKTYKIIKHKLTNKYNLNGYCQKRYNVNYSTYIDNLTNYSVHNDLKSKSFKIIFFDTKLDAELWIEENLFIFF